MRSRVQPPSSIPRGYRNTYIYIRTTLLELDGKRPVSGIERLYTNERERERGVVLSLPFGRKLIMELDRTIILRVVSSKMIFLWREEGRIVERVG